MTMRIKLYVYLVHCPLVPLTFMDILYVSHFVYLFWSKGIPSNYSDS